MKVKNLFSILAMAFVMLFIVGCGNSPKEALEDWCDAILDGEFDEARKYCTGDQDNIKNTLDFFDDDDDDAKAKKVILKNAVNKLLEEDVIIEDGYAIIRIDNRMKCFFKKKNGEWKVLIDENLYFKNIFKD